MEEEKTIFQKIADLEAQEKTAAIERTLLLEKALKSADANLIFKAQGYLQRQKKVPEVGKSMLIDPYSINQSMGYAEKQYTISYSVLRNMARVPIVKSIIDTRVEQIATFIEPQRDKYSTGFVIKPKRFKANQEDKEKLTKQEERDIAEITEFLLNCGTRENEWHGDTLDSLTRKFIPDCLSLDQGTFEVVRNRMMEPTEVIATDGSTFRIADSLDDDTYKGDKKKVDGYFPSYVQVWDGRIIADFYPWELCFGVRNPQSSIYSNGYGRSELEDLIQTVTSILHADQYNANYFKLGSNPKGILKVSGNINTSRIEEFRGQWQAQMAGVANCITGDCIISTQTEGKLSILHFLQNEDSKECNIWVGDHFEKALVYKTNELKKLCTTYIDEGYIINTSPDHRFKVKREKEDIWIKQSELCLTDYVFINEGECEIPKKVIAKRQSEILVQMYDVEVYDDIHQFVGNGVIIHNSHRMPIIEADKLDFINTQTSNKDMEYSKYYEFLIKISCACYKIDPSEIGFPMNGSADSKPMFEGNNEGRLKYSKDKGLKPLLRFYQAKLNKYIVNYLKDGKYELTFVGLDTDSAADELEADIKKINAGLMDLETGMAKYGHKLNEKKDIILNPVYLQYLQMKQMGGSDSNEFMDNQEGQEEENPFEKGLQDSWDRLMVK